MSKKQALTEFHRGSILAAAERLFAEKGTEKTTMDDIAREAEYSKATLYVYFQSKEEIINAILLSGMVLLKKKIHEAIESHSDCIRPTTRYAAPSSGSTMKIPPLMMPLRARCLWCRRRTRLRRELRISCA